VIPYFEALQPLDDEDIFLKIYQTSQMLKKR
jgi:hypothetical protein